MGGKNRCSRNTEAEETQAAITHPDTCGPIRGGEAARVEIGHGPY